MTCLVHFERANLVVVVVFVVVVVLGGGGGGAFCASYILHPRCSTPTLLAQFTVLFTLFSRTHWFRDIRCLVVAAGALGTGDGTHLRRKDLISGVPTNSDSVTSTAKVSSNGLEEIPLDDSDLCLEDQVTLAS